MQENEQVRQMKEREEEKRRERLAYEITLDFRARREARRNIENGWSLNMQFVAGNQYCDVTPEGGLEEEDAQYFWQTHRVFNHIAPTVDSRVAKLVKSIPEVKAAPFSDEDSDMRAAQLSTGILAYAFDRAKANEAIADGIMWSEVCGSVFYKVCWDETAGRKVGLDENGMPLYEGEACISVIPPYEIFPDRLDCEFSAISSLIHAQAVSTEYIADTFGVAVAPDPESEISGVYSGAGISGASAQFTREASKTGGKTSPGRVILLERYTLPTNCCTKGSCRIKTGCAANGCCRL